MATEFVEITLGRATTAFRTAIPDPSGLQGHTRLTLRVGVAGITGINRDPHGGFDILGEDNQHFWVPDANVAWARKQVCP